jgi:integrase/recombinase XerD
MNITKLSAYLEEFLALKRTMAEADPHYDAFDRRSLRHKEKLLKNFLAFWHHHGRRWPIRAAHVLDWLVAEGHPQHPYRDQHRFYTLRAFLQQLRVFEPETEVPGKIFKFRRPRRTPRIFTEREIVLLMRATRRLRLFEAFRPLTLRTMIGLLASTGMRIGEVLRLTIEEAKLTANPPYLLIYETKFGKSRNVVLHPTTAHRLRRYLAKRGEVLGNGLTQTFFTNISGKPLGYASTRSTFRRLLKHARIQSVPGQRAPSLHSFRHTFTVTRLTRWHLERRNVQELLPHLSVYLGHVGPENTYWYLTATPELLQTAAVLFDRQQTQGAANP